MIVSPPICLSSKILLCLHLNKCIHVVLKCAFIYSPELPAQRTQERNIYLLTLALRGQRLTQRELNSHISRVSHRPGQLSMLLWSSYVEEVEKHRGGKQEERGPAEVRACQTSSVCSLLA